MREIKVMENFWNRES